MPHNFELYRIFISIFRKFPDTKKSVDLVYNRIEAVFGHSSPEIISFLAQRPLHDYVAHKQLELYKEKEEKRKQKEAECSSIEALEEEELEELSWVDIDTSFDLDYYNAFQATLTNFAHYKQVRNLFIPRVCVTRKSLVFDRGGASSIPTLGM